MTEQKTKTRPETVRGGLANRDERTRHIVEEIGCAATTRCVYSDVALCGQKIEELATGHSGKICQACVNEQRRRHG